MFRTLRYNSLPFSLESVSGLIVPRLDDSAEQGLNELDGTLTASLVFHSISSCEESHDHGQMQLLTQTFIKIKSLTPFSW